MILLIDMFTIRYINQDFNFDNNNIHLLHLTALFDCYSPVCCRMFDSWHWHLKACTILSLPAVNLFKHLPSIFVWYKTNLLSIWKFKEWHGEYWPTRKGLKNSDIKPNSFRLILVPKPHSHPEVFMLMSLQTSTDKTCCKFDAQKFRMHPNNLRTYSKAFSNK
jgi:hypothetical protein